MLAGGPTERGRLDQVRLLRDGEQTMVDVTRPQSGLAATPIRSGDQLVLDRRAFLFRDYIAPAGSIVAAIAAILNIVITNR